jgi:hypothetical protein
VSGATSTLPVINSDLYSRIASCYVYSRGGVRLKYVDNAAVTATAPIYVFLDTRNVPGAGLSGNGVEWSTLNAGNTANATDRNNMPNMYYRSGYSGEVQIPQYHRFHSRVNSDCATSLGNFYTSGATGLAPRISVSRSVIPSGNSEAAIYRSVSDDANFGSFLSVPPMFPISVAQV